MFASKITAPPLQTQGRPHMLHPIDAGFAMTAERLVFIAGCAFEGSECDRRLISAKAGTIFCWRWVFMKIGPSKA